MQSTLTPRNQAQLGELFRREARQSAPPTEAARRAQIGMRLTGEAFQRGFRGDAFSVMPEPAPVQPPPAPAAPPPMPAVIPWGPPKPAPAPAPKPGCCK